jgi:hypothetical protein
VIFTALLLAQLAPASTVTDELALGDADAEAPELPVLALDAGAVAGAELLLPLLHAAREVTAARAAIPARASRGRLLLVVLVLSLFTGRTPLFLCFSGGRSLGVRS